MHMLQRDPSPDEPQDGAHLKDRFRQALLGHP